MLYEQRVYLAQKWVCTTEVEDGAKAVNKDAFMRLFAYITGANNGSKLHSSRGARIFAQEREQVFAQRPSWQFFTCLFSDEYYGSILWTMLFLLYAFWTGSFDSVVSKGIQE